MVKVENLVKRYGTNYALNDVSFEIGEGEVVGLLGPNGAGKSTAMNIITGFLSTSSGSAYINGIDILKDPIGAKRNIGFLPEQPPLYPEMTVAEYLNFVYELKGVEFPREAHISEILSTVKLTDVRDRLIKNLSKGYKQRVGIAQALIGDPKIVIFDEPTVGLDPKQIIEVRNLIRTLGREHTVILSTHILSEVQSVADRIIIINEGKLLADEKTENINRTINESSRYMVKICGPQREVLEALKGVSGVTHAEVSSEREKDSYTYHVESESGYDMRKNLFFAMAEKQWPVIAIEEESVSLEDVFIRLTDTKANEGKAKGGRR
jgi:ABC-2 type transport system ATP-binding protein